MCLLIQIIIVLFIILWKLYNEVITGYEQVNMILKDIEPEQLSYPGGTVLERQVMTTIPSSTIPSLLPSTDLTLEIPALPRLKSDFWSRHARAFQVFSLIVSDLLSLCFSIALAVRLRFLFNGKPIPSDYADLLPASVLLLFTIFAVSGAYTRGLGPVDELRKMTVSTTINFLAIATLSFWLRNAILYSRLSYVIAWAFALVFIPLAREFTRETLIRINRWCEPVAIIGNGPVGAEVARYLLKTPRSGFVPVVIVDRRKENRGDTAVIPVVPAADVMVKPESFDAFKGIQTAVIITSEISEDFYQMVSEDKLLKFNHLIIVSRANQASSVWVQPYDIGGILGLEVKHNLLDNSQKLIKRTFEIFTIFLTLPILLPFFLLVMLLIRLDSKGKVFYHHSRIGYNGETFKVWKFRTMYSNADEVLKRYLKENPDAKEEWEQNHKLKDDPRITRLGRIMRKLSIDEFPQLINVLKGEMSLVGPRPIVDAEISHYGRRFNLYKQVLPGMTGLWQVSGRSDVDYGSRVKLDEYYVRNWSIWLDLYIFTRTGWAVISGRGSY